MKLFSRAEKKEGDKLEDAWLSFGKMGPGGWHLSVALCLPQLLSRSLYNSGPFALQRGWYVPRITVMYGPIYKLTIVWHWEFIGHFMGEEHVERYDRAGNLLNCPRCNGHILSRHYTFDPSKFDPNEWPSVKDIPGHIHCETCKYEYPEPSWTF
jgi:hypothetical protein